MEDEDCLGGCLVYPSIHHLSNSWKEMNVSWLWSPGKPVCWSSHYRRQADQRSHIYAGISGCRFLLAELSVSFLMGYWLYSFEYKCVKSGWNCIQVSASTGLFTFWDCSLWASITNKQSDRENTQSFIALWWLEILTAVALAWNMLLISFKSLS